MGLGSRIVRVDVTFVDAARPFLVRVRLTVLILTTLSTGVALMVPALRETFTLGIGETGAGRWMRWQDRRAAVTSNKRYVAHSDGTGVPIRRNINPVLNS